MVYKVNYFFSYLLLFFISFISFSLCGDYDIDASFNYPLIRRLNNGNYIAMTSKGIYLYSDDFSSKMQKYQFSSLLFENDNQYVYSADIVQFSGNDGGYIVFLIRNETYVFSKELELQAHLNLDYIEFRVTYKIIPYGNNDNNYNFLIIQVDSNNLLIRKYRYTPFTIEFVDSYYISCGDWPYQLSFSCELMNYNGNQAVTCFFGKWDKLFYASFYIDSFTKIDERSNQFYIEGMDGGQYFVTSIFPENRDKLMCCTQRDGNIDCFAYNITSDEITYTGRIERYDCNQEVIQMRIDYFPETKEFLFGCKRKNFKREFYMGKCNLNLECVNYGLIQNVIPAECSDSNIFHFTYYSGKYSIINDSTYCQKNRLSSFDTIPSTKISEYPSDGTPLEVIHTCDEDEYKTVDDSKCFVNIPDGYYYNGAENKIVYKCHSDCSKCENMSDEISTICNKCQDNTKYLYLGNCVTNCDSGVTFIDEEDNEIIRCKCTYDKCKYCTRESISKSNILCKTCNMDSGYYPKEIDSTNEDSFINCYKDPEGFYFDTNIYKKCYETCKKCDGVGDSSNHNCRECINNHLYLTDFGKNNCYEKCTYNYYYDVNNIYQCSSGDNCPDNYKLVPSKNKCIKDCKNDELYKYEYNGICYERCPSETYYNYNHTFCLGEIPDGYYCNSIESQTIEKCHDNCKTCKEGGTDQNNNCLTCPKTEPNIKYYDLGNCTNHCINNIFTDIDLIEKCKCSKNIKCENCTKESIDSGLCITCNNGEGYYKKSDDEERPDGFIDCYKNPEGYYIDNNIYKKCYPSCKFCTGYGSDSDNKCIECKEGYETKNDFENDNNCYIKCNYNYYYDSDGKYKCTEQDDCPTDFPKLVSEKKRCINDCIYDNTYKYDYNGICLIDCPGGTHKKTGDEYKCEGDLNCEIHGKYYNYDLTACTDEVEDGYYCNNTSLKTVDRCHNNCQTCKEGPENNNDHCLTCPKIAGNTKYFDLGNCSVNCINGIFTDTDLIEKCKCSKNNKCENCTKGSIELDLCITCNNGEGYYSKIDDEERSDGFIDCYKNPEGYYKDDNIYKKCYPSCKFCTGYGSDSDNECIECKEGYETKNDFENDNNCYKKCEFNYYYYDTDNKYNCTDNEICPEGLDKLIIDKKRCVDNCNNYNLYEYNNKCFNECPNGTHLRDNKCLDDLNCEKKNKYYNYEQLECIDNITPGFYCNDSILKTIDKCHDYCKTCEEKGTDENNNCLTCPDTGKVYLDLGNCKESCINGYFFENSIKKCKCSTNIACYYCSKESKEYDLCESCNTEKGYYPKNDDENNVGSFIKCYNNETIFCNYYYYLNNSKYYCTGNDKCPEDFKFLVKDKKTCTDDCTKDDEYKYQYNNNCYKMCPKNTTNSKDNKYICESCKEGLCGDAVVLLNEVNDLIEDFPENNSCDNNHVSVEENENFTIYIYQNNNCPENPSQLPLVDFGDCYNTIKKENNISENEELIVTKVVIKQNNTSVYSFFNPKTLQKLDSTPCQAQKIIVQEEITNKVKDSLDDSKEQLILNLLSQGINVFNISDPFYTDLCYQFESPNGKDAPLKVRLVAFFPNITLCEEGCENIGVNTETMKAKCECKFIDLVNMDIMSDNIYGKAIQEIFEIISELNIAVVKCFKDIFNKKYFIKNTGGFIILSLFIGQVICFIVYSVDGLYYIRKYLLNLLESYINYTNRNGNNLKNNNINIPPKRKRKNINKDNSILSKNILICNTNSNKNLSSSKKAMVSISSKRIRSKENFPRNKFFSNKTNIQTLNSEFTPKSNKKYKYKISKKAKEMDISNNVNKNPDLIDIKEYLSLSFDENDFDDVIDKEKRTFCAYFCEKFKLNQIFINTFYIKEPLRPRSLKILVLIMTIESYFVVNAIFYSEDYLSELFYSKKEEKFYSFIPRRINEFIYTFAVSGVISYFVGYVFVEETKIKKTFIRNKGGDIKLKYEISVIINGIKNKFATIIAFSLFLTVICFIYISCFNNVYPNIKGEWIISSLFILFLMQLINFALTLLECILRYISIKCNSEKLFKLSQIFAL